MFFMFSDTVTYIEFCDFSVTVVGSCINWVSENTEKYRSYKYRSYKNFDPDRFNDDLNKVPWLDTDG